MIQKEIPNDGLTPIQVYRTLGAKGCCILESAHERGEGKISLIGIGPIGTFKATAGSIEIELEGKKSSFKGDPYLALKQFAENKRAFGLVSYDAVRVKETLPNRHPSDRVPDFFFHLYQTIITFEHEKQKIVFSHEGPEEDLDEIIARCFKPAPLTPFKAPKPVPTQSDIDPEEFMKMVDRAKEYIRAGDIFQVVLSRTFRATVKAPPFEIYRALRQTSPAPYHFFFEEEDFAVTGASPELLVSIQNGEVESMPIAGTCPKECDPMQLLSDPKECAEHVMLVDLARNDVGAVAIAGSVQVAEYKVLKSYSHVHHIVSRVTGKLRPPLDPLAAFKESLPAGTLSGAPKIRAMEIIDELEQSRRGLYGGAIVTLDANGDLTSCIAIRMAYIRGSEVEIRTGAGIVLDSVREKEFAETAHKARGVIAALELAEGGA